MRTASRVLIAAHFATAPGDPHLQPLLDAGFEDLFRRGISPEITLADFYKYRGVTGFVILQLIGLTAVLLWPKLATWLPSLAYR